MPLLVLRCVPGESVPPSTPRVLRLRLVGRDQRHVSGFRTATLLSFQAVRKLACCQLQPRMARCTEQAVSLEGISVTGTLASLLMLSPADGA